MKKLRFLGIFAITFALVFAATSCQQDTTPSDGSSSDSSSSSSSETSVVDVTLTIKPNGAPYSDVTQTVKSNESVTLSSPYADGWLGYKLLGWSTIAITPSTSLSESDSHINYTVGQSVKFSSDTTLYAVWKIVGTINVDFYANGGQFDGDRASYFFASYTGKVSIGEEYSLANVSERFTRTGYTLLGWSKTAYEASSSITEAYCAVAAEGTTTFTGTEDSTINLYAVWKIDSDSDINTISGGTIEISAASYLYSTFTLNKYCKLTAEVEVEDSDYGVKIYLLTSENFTKYKNGKSFSYYSDLSSTESVNLFSSSGYFSSGTYYFVIENPNLLVSRTVYRKLSYSAL